MLVQYNLRYTICLKTQIHLTDLLNASETIKVGGHLCGTCYDGTRVLKCCRAKQDESVTLMDGEIKCGKLQEI